MGRILFVTVGTSAITNQQLWEDGDLDPALPQDGYWGELIKSSEDACIKELTRHGRAEVNEKIWLKVKERVDAEYADFEKALTDLHRKFWDRNDHYRRDPRNRKKTSAETISTWLAGVEHRIDGTRLEAGEDKVVLVASRTCIGQMAARINQAIFTEFLFSGSGQCEVVIETVDDLRLEGIREEKGEAVTLLAELRRIYENHTFDLRKPLFNITGGFKGLIPAITVVCSEPPAKTMIYQHESMRSTVLLRFENNNIMEEVYEEYHVD